MFRKFKLAVGYVFSMISLCSLVYYMVRFYFDRYIEFTQEDNIGVTIVCTMIILSIIIGMVNTYKTSKQSKKIDKLTILIENLSRTSDENYDSIVHYITNNRDIMLDGFDTIGDK